MVRTFLELTENKLLDYHNKSILIKLFIESYSKSYSVLLNSGNRSRYFNIGICIISITSALLKKHYLNIFLLVIAGASCITYQSIRRA